MSAKSASTPASGRGPGPPLVFAAHSDEEARALAWRRWYGREPTTEFDQPLRAVFSLTNSREPAA